MSKEKRMTESEWLRMLKPDKFQEVFVDWYLPALRSKFLTLENRIKKLERPGK